MSSPRRLGRVRLFPVPPGLPGSSADLSPRAVSNHPGRSDGCSHPLLHRRCQASPLSGGLATFVFVTRPNRVRSRYGSRVRPSKASPVRITPTRACRATCRTGNLQGELLSVHQIDQAYPGATRVSPARSGTGQAEMRNSALPGFRPTRHRSRATMPSRACLPRSRRTDRYPGAGCGCGWSAGSARPWRSTSSSGA